MAKGKERNPMYIDTTSAAELFEVTPKAVIDWEKKAGVEKKSFRVSHGIYHIKKLLAWWLENIHESKQETKGEKDSRERYWHAKADQAEIDVAIKRKELFPKEEIAIEWAKRISEIRQGLLSLPVKLPPLLEGKTQVEMRPQIKDAVCRLLDAYARDGRFTPEKKARKS